jgi:NAD(P)-dependent dehydrogenase (short-subunit alcohol dehydrogenase family)
LPNRVAFVTGASRGIGKATVLALAAEGFDIVATARTRQPGQQVEHMVRGRDGKTLPGSLEETEAAVRQAGHAILSLHLDLLDRPSMERAVAAAVDRFGRIDVLVNNAIYQGEGLNDRFLDGDFDAMERVFAGNAIAQAFLTRLVLPHMLAAGGGTVINLTSSAALVDPPYAVDEGGWSYAHGATKAALHRMAGVLDVELGNRGIRAYNLEPGIVTSESFLASMGDDARILSEFKSAPVSAEAAELSGGDPIHAQPFCKRRGLLPGWPPAAK